MSNSLSFVVTTSAGETQRSAQDSDSAVNEVLAEQDLPFEDFISVYQQDPTPLSNCRYGAPMGRAGTVLDHETRGTGKWKARIVLIDEQGYDPGGAYWGLRNHGESLFCVQDGMGNLAFVDAAGEAEALENAAL